MPWPKVVYGVGTPAYPDEGVGLYKDGLPRAIEENEELEVRTYIPVSALLSDEAQSAARKRFPDIEPHVIEGVLETAIEQVGGAR